MKTQYANINAFDSRGDIKIICDDTKTENSFYVVRSYYDLASCGYGMTAHKKTLARFADLKSALLYIAGIV